MFSRISLSAYILATALCVAATPAFAQRQIDDPKLSPMLFGETRKEKEEKIRKEREEQEEALRITQEQEQDAQQIDDPKMRPLIFGPDRDEYGDIDPTGTQITLGESDDNRRFFGILTYLVPDETNLSIGLGPEYEPDYFGSNDYEVDIDPQVYVKFRNFVFFDDDGADFALFGFSRFRVGPSIRLRGSRREDENPALQGLGDVERSVELGGFIGTTFLDRFAVKAKVRHGVTGHKGTIVDGFLTALIFRAGPVSLSASGQAAWISDDFADTYFSVTPEQSFASNGRLSVYEADSGFRNVGASVNGYINVGKRWSLNPYASWDYIFDDYAETPIIRDFGDRNQYRVGFHIMREFTFGGRK